MGTVIVSEETKSSSSRPVCLANNHSPDVLRNKHLTATFLSLTPLFPMSTIYVTTLSHVIGVSIKCRTEGWSIVGEVFKERQKSRTEIISAISCASSSSGRDGQEKHSTDIVSRTATVTRTNEFAIIVSN